MQGSNAKKIIIFIVSILGAIAVGASCVLLASFFTMRTAESVVQQPSADISENRDYLYCMKEQNGKIVVFEKGNDQPIKTLETDPSVLPDHDRQLLKEGIYLNSDQELRKLLEDYDD